MNYLEKLAATIRSDVGDSGGDDLGVFVLYALVARAKGSSATAEDVHDAWVAWKTLRGEDRSMREFTDLTADERALDEPFAAAIRRASAGARR